MGYQIFQGETLLLVRSETFAHEVFEVLGKRLKEVDAVAVDFLNQLLLTVASPGRLSMKHLVKDDSYRPNIVFDGINISV